MITETATTTETIKAMERPASRRSTMIPTTVMTSAMISTYWEMNPRSDHWMSAGRRDRSPPARAVTLVSGPPAGAPSARSRCLRLVAVPDSPHRDDALGKRRVGFELFPEPPRMHGDGGGVPERPAPYLGEQLLPGEGLARVLHEEDQQVILPRGELDQLAVDPDLMGGQVHHQVAVGDGAEVGPVGQARAARPAQHRADPERQLPRAEGLGDVVVRARLEADQAGGLVSEGGQHHDRDRPAGPQPAADLEPVHAGQHQVKHHEVGRLFGHPAQGLIPVVHTFDRMAVPY